MRYVKAMTSAIKITIVNYHIPTPKIAFSTNVEERPLSFKNILYNLNNCTALQSTVQNLIYKH